MTRSRNLNDDQQIVNFEIRAVEKQSRQDIKDVCASMRVHAQTAPAILVTKLKALRLLVPHKEEKEFMEKFSGGRAPQSVQTEANNARLKRKREGGGPVVVDKNSAFTVPPELINCSDIKIAYRTMAYMKPPF